jgi:uncharacterized repeat protein (TIGR03803 family)
VLAFALTITGVRAQTYSVLHTFQYFPHGASPYAPLFRGAGGELYGAANGGGPFDAGVLFRLDTAGSQTVLHTFTGGSDGGNPCGGVVTDSSGNLYGTAYQGGIPGAGVNKRGAGVIYKIDNSGQYTILYSFTGGADGSGPIAGVVVDAAGNLYGTTYSGGAQGYGVVFKLNAAGQESVLHSFMGAGASDGANPFAGVTEDAAGNLYGTTYGGGAGLAGVVYKLAPSGQETVLCSFGGSCKGGAPFAGVVLDAAGNIYGAAGSVVYELNPVGSFTELAYIGGNTLLCGIARDSVGDLYITSNGGEALSHWKYGAVFKLVAGGKADLLYQFDGGQVAGGTSLPGSSGQNASVVVDSAGNLYGTSPLAGTAGIVYEIEASGTVKKLYDFKPAQGGATPRSGLTLHAGNFYGTAEFGGGGANAGVVYKLSPAGQETVLYTFKGGKTDGADPEYNVVVDQAGNLYGVTIHGGTYNQGTVYKLTPSGQETILHTFTGRADGSYPTGLALDSAGNLYGAAASGGEGSQTGLQEGVVFKLDVAGSFSLLHSFTGLSDGGGPNGVLLDGAGNLYGTTYSGGLGNPGAGVVFKIDASGAYTVLHAFLAATDGGYPEAGVTLDSKGNIYGTCGGYGPQNGGTVFKLSAADNFSVLYAFVGGAASGFPLAGVVRDGTGNLYGTISIAGDASFCPGTPGACGIVYKIDTSGVETVLYSFSGGLDGSDPETPVTLDGIASHLYGVADGVLSPVQGGVAFKIALP